MKFDREIFRLRKPQGVNRTFLEERKDVTPSLYNTQHVEEVAKFCFQYVFSKLSKIENRFLSLPKSFSFI